MTRLARVVRAAHGDLTEAGAAHAVVGGLAVSARAEPRFTRDADFAVATVSDAQAEAVILAMRFRGYVIDSVLEHRSGRMSTVRLRSPKGSGLVDLRFASSGVEAEIVASAETLTLFRQTPLPVARTANSRATTLPCPPKPPASNAGVSWGEGRRGSCTGLSTTNWAARSR